MLKFQRALLVDLFLVFLGVLSVVTVVVFGGTAVQLVVKGQGVGIRFLVDLMPSLLPISLSYSIPFAWLAAVAIVLGRMVADREVMALRAAGLHLRVLVAPVATVALLLGLMSAAFNVYVVPSAQRSIREGVRRYVSAFLSSLKGVNRSVALNNGRFSFSNYHDGSFWDVELDRRRGNGELQMKIAARRVTIQRPADAGQRDALDFVFEDGYVLAAGAGEPKLDRRANINLQMGRVKRIGTSVFFNEFFGTRRFRARPKDLTFPHLLYAAEAGGVWRGSMLRVRTALHQRLALGLAVLAMGLCALGTALTLPPTGRRVRDFLICFLPPVLVFFPLYLAGPPLAAGGAIPPWLALWIPDLVVGGAGLFLIARVFRR